MTDLTEITPELTPFLKDADHVDVKTYRTDVPMRHFIAGMLSYMPSWLRLLYGVRWGLVRLLGMTQEGVPQKQQMQPHEVSMTAGDHATFFTVKGAAEERYWIAGATEPHLTATLAIVVDPDPERQIHVVTIVHYHKWSGPLYFNVIRPFHHIVVDRMAQAALRTPPGVPA